KKTLLLLALLFSAACATQQSGAPQATPTPAAGAGDQAFKAIHDKYVVEFLRRNPSVNTYLGGAGLDPSLKEADGRLRDHSASALAEEDRWLADTQSPLRALTRRRSRPRAASTATWRSRRSLINSTCTSSDATRSARSTPTPSSLSAPWTSSSRA